MNVENYSRAVAALPSAGQSVRPGAPAPVAGTGGEPPSPAVGGQTPAGDRPLTVRAAAQDPAAEAARRLEPACDAAATSCDALDALIKSVLDFEPPPMPNFGIMSENSP